MKKLKEILTPKTIVLYFCECNPPTLNHLVAFSATKQIAEDLGADYVILISNNRVDESHSLTLSQKLEYINVFFPGFNVVGASENMKTPVDVARIYNKTYKNLIEVTGVNSVEAYTALHENFNNHAYYYDSIEVITTGEIDPDISSVSKMMKRAIVEGDMKILRKGLLSYAREVDVRRFMNDSRRGLGLDSIKESIQFATSDLREKYVAGEIFLENSFVESNSQLFKIINRNSNYVTVSDSSGILSKKWLTDIQPTEASEAMQIEFERITEMKFSSADKIKVGKIIGGMLGADVSNGSNAEAMVNAGLRITRTKSLNAEAISILQNMLKTADEAGINYDAKLVPTKVTDRSIEESEKNLLIKDKKTGKEYDPEREFDKLLHHPDTKAQLKRMKDERGRGWPHSDAHESVLEDKDNADRQWIIDPVTGKGRWSRAGRVTFNLKNKVPDEVIGGRVISDSVEVELDETRVPVVKSGIPTGKKVRISPKSSKLNVGDKVKGDYPGDEDKNLHVTYVHTSGKVKLADHNGVAQPNYRNPENIKKIDESNKHIDPMLDHINSIKARTEQSHLKGERYHTLYKNDQVIADAHHLHLNSLGGRQVQLPTGAVLGGSDDQHIRRKVNYESDLTDESVNECSVDELEAEPGGQDNITDNEIDDMIDHIQDWDDIVSAYDSSELSYVDTNTGKHVADVSDRYEGEEGDPCQQARGKDADVTVDTFDVEKELPTGKKTNESEINEVMTKSERVKTALLHHTKATKNPVKVALKRRSTPAQLNRRARTLAIKTLKLNLAKKPLSQLSANERHRIDAIVIKKAPLIHRIAIRLMSKIKKIEQNRMSHPNFTKKD